MEKHTIGRRRHRNMNRSITIKAVKTVIIYPDTSGQNHFANTFFQTFKMKKIPVRGKLYQKLRRKKKWHYFVKLE
jgi:hypothetical protein